MWVVEHVRRVAAYAAGEDTVRKAEESSSSSPPRSPEAEADADAQRDDGGNNRNGARYEPQSVATTLGVRNREAAQREKLLRVLNSSTVDIDALREISWGGIPPDLRPICWQLMLGYLPPKTSAWNEVMAYKREAYKRLLREHYETSNSRRSEAELVTLRQIAIDAPRTEPGVRLFSRSALQRSLIRILYVRAITHPSSGYVQGLNDVLTPFLETFLSRVFHGSTETWDVDSLAETKLQDVEGDCYWCFCKLMDRVEHFYTRGQPGIRDCVARFERLVARIDGDLSDAMAREGLEFMHFSIRWFNCLLLREVPFRLAGRLWDTYIAEVDRFEDFIVYVALALLLHHAERVRSMEFQDMILFLQKLPTAEWTEKEVEMTLATAHLWMSIFGESSAV